MSEIAKVAIATSPQASDVHVSRPLNNFSQLYMQSQTAFQGLRAFPNLPVAKQADLYYEFNRGDFYRDEAKLRADGTESVGGSFDLTTNPYFCHVYSIHKDVTDRQRANADVGVNLERNATNWVTHKLLISRERTFVNTFFNTGLWGTDLTGVASGPTSSQFIRWDLATSDPIKDIRTGKRAVLTQTGYTPNKMLIGREAYDALLENDSILDRINGGATTSQPALVMRARLTELLELQAIYVMDSVVNIANKGADDSFELIGPSNALLYYAPDSVGLDEPTAGVQFSWTGFFGAGENGGRISNFRNNTTQADRIEGEMAFDYRRTGVDLGYFFNGATTP